jgi:hypothetical protein
VALALADRLGVAGVATAVGAPPVPVRPDGGAEATAAGWATPNNFSKKFRLSGVVATRADAPFRSIEP